MKDFYEYSDADEFEYEPLDIDDIEMKLDIKMKIEKLPDFERTILQMWMDGYTQEEIGVKYEFTHQRISQILREIFAKLRA